MTYIPRGSPATETEPRAFANLSFTLEANDCRGDPVTVTLRPFTLTLFYDGLPPAGMDEGSLALYWWTGSSWDDAANTCTPPSIYLRDMVAHTLSVAICHLTEWGMLGHVGEVRIFLPVVFRTGAP